MQIGEQEIILNFESSKLINQFFFFQIWSVYWFAGTRWILFECGNEKTPRVHVSSKRLCLFKEKLEDVMYLDKNSNKGSSISSIYLCLLSTNDAFHYKLEKIELRQNVIHTCFWRHELKSVDIEPKIFHLTISIAIQFAPWECLSILDDSHQPTKGKSEVIEFSLFFFLLCPIRFTSSL